MKSISQLMWNIGKVCDNIWGKKKMRGGQKQNNKTLRMGKMNGYFEKFQNNSFLCGRVVTGGGKTEFPTH
jgi:hypothetical protein